MAANTSSTNASGGGHAHMHKQLIEAATSDDWTLIRALASEDQSILLGATPRGNNCLHIASIHGNEEYCRGVMDILSADTDHKSLLSKENDELQTPLIIAIAHDHVSLASFLLVRCSQLRLEKAILQQDRDGCNALHHAIRNGHADLALELIQIVPALSQAVNKYNESPMFIAAMRDFTHVFLRLIEIPDSPNGGTCGLHALHAAARNGNKVVATKIMEKRPHLATKADSHGITPIRMAVIYNKVDVLQVLLEHDSSLADEIDKENSYPLLCSAAARGQVDVAQKLLYHCPDALYCTVNGEGYTCLHIAVQKGHLGFTEFIVRTQRLWKLINMRDNKGKTALHYAVHLCDPRLVAALLSHKSIDTTVLDNDGRSAALELLAITQNDETTLDWKEVHELLLKADPKDEDISLYNLLKGAKQRGTIQSRRQRISLTQKYTSNTSLIAVLLATITFTAAFTLPGGYSSDPGSAGLPVMSRKIAFQAFLVSDTLAMCSSFVVAFICLMGRWDDDKFTTFYIPITKNLTWFAYMTTITAFSTGLYTVLPSHLHWLAIGICTLIVFLPILTMFIWLWPFLLLQIRLSVPWPKLKLIFQLLKFRFTWHTMMLKFGFRQGYNPNSSDMV